MSKSFEEKYNEKLPLLEEAEKALLRLLNGVAASIEDKRLVRVEIRSPRIKSLNSLEAKAKENGWSASRAFDEASDLVGGRVVCNNVEDVYRFCELLKMTLDGADYFEVEDHIKTPRAGYRALHVNVYLKIGEQPFPVPVEVQIRTRLQDAWAELAHEDIYKNQDIPEDLKAMAENLAIMLEATDKIASNIRRRVASRAEVSEDIDPTKITAEGLAYVFSQVFGIGPSEYVAREAIGLARTVGLTSLVPLQEALARSEYREQLSRAYRKYIPMPVDRSEILFACIVAAEKGERRGLAWLSRRAKREADEMRALYEREVLSGLPDTIDELLEDPAGHIDDHVANALGGSDNCSICGETIILPDSMAQALVRHYHLKGDAADEAHQTIEDAIRRSDLETGGWNTSSLCSYHEERLDKD